MPSYAFQFERRAAIDTRKDLFSPFKDVFCDGFGCRSVSRPPFYPVDIGSMRWVVTFELQCAHHAHRIAWHSQEKVGKDLPDLWSFNPKLFSKLILYSNMLNAWESFIFFSEKIYQFFHSPAGAIKNKDIGFFKNNDLQMILVLSIRGVWTAVTIMQCPAQNVHVLRLGAMEGKIGAMAIVTGTTMIARKGQIRNWTPKLFVAAL